MNQAEGPASELVYLVLAACETLTSLPHHKIHNMLSGSDDVFSLGCVGNFSIKRPANQSAEEAALWTNGAAAVIGRRLLFVALRCCDKLATVHQSETGS